MQAFKKLLLLGIFILFFSEYSFSQTIIYVDESATAGLNDGSDWPNAYLDLNTALSSAVVGDEIWVAQGTYVPSDIDPTVSFELVEGVSLFGGFEGLPGTEGDFDSRDFIAFATELEGGSSFTNHIMRGDLPAGITGITIVDGFTFADGGNPGATGLNANGAGLFLDQASPTVINCLFKDNDAEDFGGAVFVNEAEPAFINCVFDSNNSGNRGGAFYGEGSTTNVHFRDCAFVDNASSAFGGAVFIANGELTSVNCEFSDNTLSASPSSGGALHAEAGASVLILGNYFRSMPGMNAINGGALSFNTTAACQVVNTVISGHEVDPSSGRGGGIYALNSTALSILNCTIANNFGNGGDGGGGIFAENCNPTIQNTILWGNEGLPTATPPVLDDFKNQLFYEPSPPAVSNVENCIIGSVSVATAHTFAGTVTESDPMFVSAAAPSNYSLQVGSPAIDNGDASFLPLDDFDLDDDGDIAEPIPFDVAGSEREMGTSVNIGAYEDTRIYYVDEDATGFSNGNNWPNAYTSLENALAAISSSPPTGASRAQVWVAEGTYITSAASNPADAFDMISNVDVIGGFSGFSEREETSVEQADPLSFICTMEGDFTSDNSYHVVRFPASTNDVLLSGFTIEGGNADGTGPDAFGGGIFLEDASNIFLENLLIENNNANDGGAGIYANNTTFFMSDIIVESNSGLSASTEGVGMHLEGGSDLTAESCFFNFNNTGNIGGGIYCADSDLDLLLSDISSNNSGQGAGIALFGTVNFSGRNCSVDFNEAASGHGGGFYLEGTVNIDLINSSVIGNSSNDGGGGVFSDIASGTETYTNCTFATNFATSPDGGGMDNEGSSTVIIRNSIFWENENDAGSDEGITVSSGGTSTITTSASIIQEGAFGGLDADPIFNDSFSGDYTLSACSPAVDAADAGHPELQDTDDLDEDGITAELIPFDLFGEERAFDVTSVAGISTLDMGCFENQFESLTGTIYVDASATGAEDGSSWANAFTDLQDALALACTGSQIWVAQGTYTPDPFSDVTVSFEIPEGVELYGGFDGTEAVLTDRDFETNITTLTGDLGGGFNSNTVVSIDFVDDVIIDGFVITEADNPSNSGGGLFIANCSPVVRNCDIELNNANEGAGAYVYASDAPVSPRFINCKFSSNISNTDGGALALSSVPGLSNETYIAGCYFESNFSSSGQGAGIFTEGDASVNPSILNCIFEGNGLFSSLGGSGIYISETSCTLSNCTFFANDANSVVEVETSASENIEIRNSIFWENTVGGSPAASFGENISISVLTGTPSINIDDVLCPGSSTPGTPPVGTTYGTFYEDDPLLDADLSPKPCSPAVDVADPTFSLLANDPFDLDDDGSTTDPIESDFYNDIRNYDVTGVGTTTLDLGAVENQYENLSVVYVDIDAIGLETGADWANAFTDLQDALAAACNGAEIWVAEGVYFPDFGTGDNLLSFNIPDGVKVLGGFDGTEALATDRDWNVNITVLSGDIGTLGDVTDNSQIVVVMEEVGPATSLDGFIIRDGNNPGGFGGGIDIFSSSALIRNCEIKENTADYGAGVSAVGAGVASTPVFINCKFIDNYAVIDGGGLYVYDDGDPIDVQVFNCIFFDNFSETGSGAGACVEGIGTGLTSANFYNSIFRANDAVAGDGGGLYLKDADGEVVHCTFRNNDAGGAGGGMRMAFDFYSGDATVQNCIFWGNKLGGAEAGSFEEELDQATSVTPTYSVGNCLIQGTPPPSPPVGYDPATIYNIDPLFINPTGGNLNLLPCSPAIDVADPAFLPVDAYDIDGDGNTAEQLDIDIKADPRTYNTFADASNLPDLGAFENQNEPLPIIYVDKDAPTGGDGSTWALAFNRLEDALSIVCSGGSPIQVWVADGTYFPDGGTADANLMFEIPENTEVYGGFNGTEAALADRDWIANITILDGDIDGDGTPTGNSYRILEMFSHSSGTSAVLDGFTVQNGNGQPLNTPASGLNVQDCGGTIEVRNCIFTNNNSGGSGAMQAIESDINISDCEFISNSVYGLFSIGAVGLDGGSAGSAATFTRVNFDNNLVPGAGSGGAVQAARASTTFTDCHFTGNSAGTGGAFVAVGTGAPGVSVHTFTDCEFTGNNALDLSSGFGGVFYITGENELKVSHSKIESNQAAEDGGALFINTANTVTTNHLFENCLIYNNTSNNADGGAFYISNIPNGDISIFNNTFFGNGANGSGGGIYRSSGDGFMINNILFGNTALLPPVTYNQQFHDAGGAGFTEDFNLAQDYGGTAPNSLAGDPLFEDETSGNFNLLPGSPAVDTGTDAIPLTASDYAGNPRIQNIAVDMGALESPVPPPTGCSDVFGITLFPIEVLSCGDSTANLRFTALFSFDSSAVDGLVVPVDFKWGISPGAYTSTATVDAVFSLPDSSLTLTYEVTVPIGDDIYFVAEAFDICEGVFESSSETSLPLGPDFGDNLIGSDQEIFLGEVPVAITDSGTPPETGTIIEWQYSEDSITWSVAGVSVPDYSFASADTTTWYRRVLTNAYCSDTSNVVKIYVAQPSLIADVEAGITEDDYDEMTALYAATGGPNWVNTWNLTEEFSTKDGSGGFTFNWHGITAWDGAVYTLNLSNNNLKGRVPPDVFTLIRSGQVSADFSGNALDFGSFEPYVSVFSPFIYDNQADINEAIDTTVLQGTDLAMVTDTWDDNGNNLYQWYKNGTAIPGAASSIYLIEGILPGDAGVYHCEVNNSVATGLTLYRSDINVDVIPTGLDSTILVKLYFATGGPTTWTVPWTLTDPVGTWPGLEFEGGILVGIDLSNNGLSGEIPDIFHPDSIDFLSGLRYLNLFDNNLVGEIPGSIFNITSLEYLDLGKNELSGGLPPEVGQLINLSTLWLESNKLTSLPPEIGLLRNLCVLSVGNNQLERLPDEIGNLIDLCEFYAGQNFLEELPASMGNMRNLNTLMLDRNKLTELPSSFSGMSSLARFGVQKNKLSDLFTGISALPLQALYTDQNALEFDDIEPLLSVSEFEYSPQDPVNERETIIADLNNDVTLSVETGGIYNEYQWFKDDELIEDAVSADLVIAEVGNDDAGIYTCQITNTEATELTLVRRPLELRINCGSALDTEISTTDPLAYCAGDIIGTEFRVREVTGYSYQWYRDGERILRATAPTLKAFREGVYFVEVNDGVACLAYSDPQEITINPLPDAGIERIASTLRYTGDESQILTFSWLRDGEKVLGGDSAELEIGANGNYQLLVTSLDGCVVASEIMEVGDITGIEDLPEDKLLLVYPNPSQGEVFIQGLGNLVFTAYSLYDANGRLIQEKDFGRKQSSHSFNFKNDAAGGLYYLKVKTAGGKLLIRKITKY